MQPVQSSTRVRPGIGEIRGEGSREEGSRGEDRGEERSEEKGEESVEERMRERVKKDRKIKCNYQRKTKRQGRVIETRWC